ncbi:MarP family serine protease [Actinomycetospora sp. TBRC 11914]|uniref:MarP family serine protease n=1 Tax=Actinomycetospora sp. TBRC 11914 TaxID=2729387 RepID=UPI00145D9C16|nr:MarP family serine protease [Actinomycetospora sp. TBRC 11914]NMO92195.1 MarP family serine protease [Actinomycetospora sp. TBRC 11914]
MSWVDIVVVLLAIAAAISGWRHGLAVAALSFLGVIGGALLGLKLAPLVVGLFQGDTSRVVVSVLIVIALVALGETLGVYLGRALRDRMRLNAVRTVDSTFGAVLQAITALVVAWLIALPLATSSNVALSSALKNSAVLQTVDAVMPTPIRALPNELRSMFDASGFPDVLSPFSSTPVAEVPAPNPELVRDPVVQRAKASVLKVRGRAPSCSRALEGTGFVIGDQRVMTNAHVVAGTSEVSVEVPQSGGGSQTESARVVYYDEQVDVAILAVPDLDARALPFNFSGANTGDNAVALGYPLDGPFTSSAAKIRQRIQLRGPDIYDSSTVTRDVYTIRGQVRSGNSGGPLVNPQGQVIGVVFGAAVDQGDTGFVLTADQVRAALNAAPNATSRVSTGSCAA